MLIQDPEPVPPERQAAGTWSVEFEMDGKPYVFTGLDDEAVIKKLQGFFFAIIDSTRNGLQAQESWRKEMGAEFGTRWAAAASSIVGGADWPDPSNWLDVNRQMMGAFEILRESMWSVMAARNEALDTGARARATPLTEQRMAEVVAILEQGDRAAAKAWGDWKRFLDKSYRGAERAVTGLKVAKVAGAVAATYLTGGAAAHAQLGFWGTTTALAATGGSYAATQNVAEQAGEMIFGDRDHIDWGSVAKVGVVNAAAAFVGGVIGGKFASILSNSVGKMVGGLSPQVMRTFGIEGAQLLTHGERILIQWLGNVASSPFQTSTAVLMQSGLEGKWSVTSTGDFLDLVLQDMVLNGSIGSFLSFAQSRGAGSRPSSGGAGTTDGGAGGGGDGGGPGGGGSAPPGRPTLRGMGAAGPAGENAPPASRSGDTLIGMGAAGPAGQNAPPATRSGTTMTGMGAAGPAAAARQIQPITDIAHAQAAANWAQANGVRWRWPRDPRLVQDLWVREAAQNPNSDPPAAWQGPDGLVVNGAKVPIEPIPPAISGQPAPSTPAGQTRPTERGMGTPGAGATGAPQRPTLRSGTATGEIEMPAEYVGRQPVVTEAAELAAPINREPQHRMSVSGTPGSLPEGYGVFRVKVRLPSGEIVDAAVKIYPGEKSVLYEYEVAGAIAAARTGLGPKFYGRVPMAADARFARRDQPDLAFAMEPVEGAFAHPGVDPGEPGYSVAAAESAQAASRINDRTFQDIRNFSQAIVQQGYSYGGSRGGEVQGLIGPDGRWTPIDFQGLTPLSADPDVRAGQIAEHEIWVQDEVNSLTRARDEHLGIPDEDPTDPGR